MHATHSTSVSVDRFTDPLYTVTEAARYLSVPTSTFATWVHGYTRRPQDRTEVKGYPIVTMVGDHRQKIRQHEPVIPFIGLAEGLILAAIRQKGVPLQRIRPALKALADGIGLDHALASKRLYTDGAEVLFDYAERERNTLPAVSAMQLVVLRNGQHVFSEVVADYLQCITYGQDNYAQAIQLPQYTKAKIIADPRRSFGKPIFSRGGARVSDALQLFLAGEDLQTVADEYGVPKDELEDAVRVASRRAA